MTFGLPRELAPWIALASGVACLAFPKVRLAFVAGSRRAFILVAAAVAAFLSGLYVAFYLRGGPRIIDATTYFLEARALSDGYLAWPAPEPSQATMGRFLVRDALGGGDHIAGIFPPGYPALLALGFSFGAPMVVGPLLAVAVTYATAFLADAVLSEDLEPDQREIGVRLAVALSVVCAALRYHTADTMSHGLCACLAAVALGCALRWRRGGGLGWAVALGTSLGWLMCTRPVSGAALLPVVIVAMAKTESRNRAGALRDAGAALVASLPFVALFFAHQRAATGAVGHSSQSLYYATSDAPAGCFRYGFGEGIGCRFEHGDFVDRYMPNGYGPIEALGTTGRRLAMHAIDALNGAPLAIVLVAAVWAAWRDPSPTSQRRFGPRLLSLAIAAFVVGYAPFYFDGNYPGGGARFFADVLPVEHVLVAWLAVAYAPVRLGAARSAAVVTGLSLVAFAFFAHAAHEQLRDREGGRPMFEPSALETAGIRGGLVFVDTDHGFALGHHPLEQASPDRVEVARFRGDALDTLLWEARGRPPAWRYEYSVQSGELRIEPYAPTESSHIEGENLWPAVEQRGASALPLHTSEPCASSGRWLVVAPERTDPAAPARVTLRLPAALAGRRFSLVLAAHPGTHAHLQLFADGALASSIPVEGAPAERHRRCFETPRLAVPPGARRVELVVQIVPSGPSASPAENGETGGLALDALLLETTLEIR